MRLGAPVYGDVSTPEAWIAALKKQNYRAAYCPLPLDASDSLIQEYIQAAAEADIVIAEVGAWSNPLSLDPLVKSKAVEKCLLSLELAEKVGARCCVNISGSRGAIWDGPDANNLTPETFDEIVNMTQFILDRVKPKRTFYTLETMPWAYPDSVESYQKLIEAIDRPQFAVHIDPANLINSPRLYFENANLIRDCFATFGARIKSCHAKDITLDSRMTVHLDETRPGLGNLDYRVFLKELAKLDPDTPLMLEHLPNESEYLAAAAFIREVESELGKAHHS